MVIPWVGFPLAELLKRVEPHGEARSTSRSRRCCDPEQMPGQQRLPGARLALRRGPAPGRGDAPAHASWRSASTARRCRTRTARRSGWWCRGSTASRASSRSSRSRFVEKQPPTTWNRQAPQRVRLLRQREPGGRSPALEPGDRAPHRREGFVKRRPTLTFNGYGDQVAQPLRRHGPARSSTDGGTQRPCSGREGFAAAADPEDALVYIVGFMPAVVALLCWASPTSSAPIRMRYLEQALGLWALRFLIATLAVTPLRQLVGINLLRYRRALGLLAFYYAALHLTIYLVLDQGLDFAAICRRHRQAALHHHRHGDLRRARAARRHLQQRLDPAPGRAGLGASCIAGLSRGHRRRRCISSWW